MLAFCGFEFSKVLINQKEVFLLAKCAICERGTIFGNNRSHAMNQTNRTYKTNVRKVKIVENGTPKSTYVCTSCLRSNKVTRAI